MANNKIQIKRSTSNATVVNLAPGELAFTQAGNTLHIGLPDGSGTIRIGGRQVPGVLTNNQALVANSIGEIDRIVVANLAPDKVWANGSFGTPGEVLAVGEKGEVYWVDPGTITAQPAGQNTWVQYNSSNVLAASAGFAFDDDANNLFVANSLILGGVTPLVINSSTSWENANNAQYLGGFAANNYLKLQDSATLTGNLTFTAREMNIDVSELEIGANVTVTGPRLINAVSSDLKINDVDISGNLVVSGSVVTINTVSLTVRDNIVEFASNNETTDIVDSGWFSPAGGGGNIWYSGVARIAGKSTPDNPHFKLFGTAVNPNTNPTIDPAARTGTLEAYLAPYGAGGAFFVDRDSIEIRANTSVKVEITANTITAESIIMSKPLPVVSGGTGRNSIAPDAILVGNSVGGFDELLLGATGTVLQSNGTALVYDTLDGGLF